jgi:hypothetical protein
MIAARLHDFAHLRVEQSKAACARWPWRRRDKEKQTGLMGQEPGFRASSLRCFIWGLLLVLRRWLAALGPEAGRASSKGSAALSFSLIASLSRQLMAVSTAALPPPPATGDAKVRTNLKQVIEALSRLVAD